MTGLRIAEVFGYATDNPTAAAQKCRAERWCPLVERPCTKGGRGDPLGVCSLTDGRRAAVLCPRRFLEKKRVLVDAAKLAFGSNARFVVAPELRILRVGADRRKRIGKVDYVLGKVDAAGQVIDFAALEVQAVYFSGPSLRPAFRKFMRTGHLPPSSQRRPDWRSSAQKRLMPQLALKVPVFRRWGKKFFVAVDAMFFEALPPMATVNGIANSEVTRLAYSLEYDAEDFTFRMHLPRVLFTTWEGVEEALREGAPPSPDEILEELRRRRHQGRVEELWA